MDRLIVKNFGPLKDVDIELNKINLFIGENGSGKSVLAKLVTILRNFQNLNKNEFFIKLNDFNINFFTKETYIYTNNSKITLELKNGQFSFSEGVSLANNAISDIEKLENILSNIGNMTVGEFQTKLSLENLDKYHLLRVINLDDKVKEIPASTLLDNKEFKENLDFLKVTQKVFSKVAKSKYIPAERSFISIFNQSIYTFLSADIPIPKFLISFFSEFEKAKNSIKELEFLNIKYIYTDKIEIHYTDNKYLELEKSSSGIQSALPLYLTVKYFANKHESIIIEEPEQNLFPKAQSETIQYIIEQVSKNNNLFMMTHSPYVLTTLNTLMMAYKAGKLGEEAKREVNKLFKEEQWINPSDFSAYYLEDGIARDIKGRTGLISENEIDEISDEMACDFEELLSIYREHKNGK